MWSCVRPSLGDDCTKWEKLFIFGCFNLCNPCWACIEVEVQFMVGHIQPFNKVTRAEADYGQCISQWYALSLYIVDFGVVFLNPKHHSSNSSEGVSWKLPPTACGLFRQWRLIHIHSNETSPIHCFFWWSPKGWLSVMLVWADSDWETVSCQERFVRQQDSRKGDCCW